MMPENVEKLVTVIFSFFGGVGVIGLLIFLFPEKVQIWSSYGWKFLKVIFKGAEKKYIACDIQGHINDYNNIINKKVRAYEPVGVQIKWIEKANVESFFKDGVLLIRMRKSDDQSKNFVAATMVFLSQVMLRKGKRYISSTQKRSIDLFVAKRLFEEEKPEVLEYFVENFLVPNTNSSKQVADYFDKYSVIDKAGLFFPILIQELTFLGSKVFGQRKDSLIISEVKGLIDFLKNYSERELGAKIPNCFNGRYCHFGVVIIARAVNVDSGKIALFVKYLSKIINVGIENIYMIGPDEERAVKLIENVCRWVEKERGFQQYQSIKYSPHIKFNGKRVKVDNLMILVRKKNTRYHYDSESN